ncbi:dimethyladenosine transferase 2, mitochondrial [Aplysia californica]|uniref:Dimethyladenosine transferase 2, mitochondrial n=1 Tax=Aplysia californica TaxID=6500 RepID=A0ABM0JJM0_APLCA|nr:dimethyladenosine transferase 2, mitochondrial [Aplysia californica]
MSFKKKAYSKAITFLFKDRLLCLSSPLFPDVNVKCRLMYSSLKTGDCVFRKKSLLSEMTYQQFACYVTKAKKPKPKTRPIATARNNEVGQGQDHASSLHQQHRSQPLRLSVTQVLQNLKENSKSRPKHAYVFDEETARSLVTTVLKNRRKQGAPLLEIQAGPGMISRELLRSGVSKVIALETNKAFTPLLREVQDAYGAEKFEFFEWPMLSLFPKLNTSKKDNSVKSYNQHEQVVVEKLRTASLSHGKTYSILVLGGQAENKDFLFYLIRNLPLGDEILAAEGVEFFFLVHPKMKLAMENLKDDRNSNKSSPNLSYLHILAHLLYDFEVIGKFQADSFWLPFSAKKSRRLKDLDTSVRFLVRMRLKEKREDVLPLHQHAPFSIFLRQLYKKTKARVIPTLEMLVPGCGLRVIGAGFTMMDIIGPTQTERFLALYKEMLTWPEYASSPLHNHILVKTTGGIEQEEEEEEERVHDDLVKDDDVPSKTSDVER